MWRFTFLFLKGIERVFMTFLVFIFHSWSYLFMFALMSDYSEPNLKMRTVPSYTYKFSIEFHLVCSIFDDTWLNTSFIAMTLRIVSFNELSLCTFINLNYYLFPVNSSSLNYMYTTDGFLLIYPNISLFG